MDRTLAAKHGVDYVRLAAFAVDVDRIREAAGDDDPRPFGWEIFLTEAYLLAALDPAQPSHVELVEDACLSILDCAPGESPLGGQLPFAVYDLVRRGRWPQETLAVFRQWKGSMKGLVKDLDPLFENAQENARTLARSCLTAALHPPPAHPTLETFGALVAGRLELT